MALNEKTFGAKKRTRSQIGKASKGKGKVGEREIVHLLKKHGFNAARGQQFRGSPDSPDVICKDLEEYHIEVKRVERFSLYKAMSQAAEDAGEGQDPIVFHRSNGEKWVVVIDAEKFLELVKASKEKLV